MNDSPQNPGNIPEIIRKEYAANLPEKLDIIDQLVQKLDPGDRDETLLNDLHQRVHQLGGSGTTFGFNRLSEVAREFDRALQSFKSSGESLSIDEQSRFQTFIDTMKQTLIDSDNMRNPLSIPDSVPVPELTADPESVKNIFLVEDDLDLAQDLAHQIGSFGYKVQIFKHPADLKEALQYDIPTAIIADIMFPEGDLAGPELIQDIQHVMHHSFPVIFISSRTDMAARLMAVKAGGDEYISKPIDIIHLIDKLDRLTLQEVEDPYRVLIIDDDDIASRHYKAYLEQSGMITRYITNPLKVLDLLTEFRPDIILMDVYMPGCSGTQLATVIRQQDEFVSIPIVFHSIESDLDKQIAALREGGDDFVSKSVDLDKLVSLIKIRVQRSRTLKSFMIRDGLTGLLNHSATKEQLKIEVANASRNNAEFSFAILDIDDFKTLNDTLGHLAGDKAIKSLARLLQLRLRNSDIVGRFGGDEFAVVLPRTRKKDAANLMDQLRVSFSQIRQQSKDKRQYLSFSCGVASYPEHETALKINDAADKALYKAKQKGKNRIEVS